MVYSSTNKKKLSIQFFSSNHIQDKERCFIYNALNL